MKNIKENLGEVLEWTPPIYGDMKLHEDFTEAREKNNSNYTRGKLNQLEGLCIL